MSSFKITVVCAILFANFALVAAEQAQEKTFDLSGQIRLRGETDDKDFDNTTKAIDYSLLRTRLNVKFNLTDHVTAFAQLQDSRIYGEEGADGATSTLTSIKNVDLSQGYVQIDQLFFPWLAYKFGRMRLNYGAQRLLGVNEFSNVGRAFDASVVMLTFEKLQIDLIQSILHESLQAPDTSKGDQILSGFWLKFPLQASNLNLYSLIDQDLRQNPAGEIRFNRVTTGGRFEGKVNAFDVQIESNLQVGKMDFITDIFATYLSGALGYTFSTNSKPQLTIGVDYLSGDKPETNRYECFNIRYHAKHRYFGYMDYFTDIPRQTRDLGLTDYILKAKISPLEKLRLEGDLHVFQLSKKTTLKNNSLARDLGTELDLTFIYDYAKSVNFTFGGSAFLPGQVFKEWKGQDPSFWFYAQTTVNF